MGLNFNKRDKLILFGCVDRGCCPLLANHVEAFDFLIALAFGLLLVSIIAAIRADFWLYKETPKGTSRIKVISEIRAFWILVGSSCFTAISLLALIIYFSSGLGRHGGDSVELEDLVHRINKNTTHSQIDNLSQLHSCSNHIMDGLETDIDCGGDPNNGGCPTDQRCMAGRGCELDSDCISGLFCDSTYKICAILAPEQICSNGRTDYPETDIDCGGGGSCPRCLDGMKCTAHSDCEYGECSRDGYCISCFDGIWNGDEGDVDCGSKSCVRVASSGNQSLVLSTEGGLT